MKKTIKLFGIIALAAVIGFSMAGCDNPAGGDNTGDNTTTVTTPGGDTPPNNNPPGDPVAVTGVTLNKTTLNLIVGGTEALTAVFVPANATNKGVTWESSNTAVATVANGTVTAVAAGTTTITVKTADGEKTATCAVTVYPAPESIAITTPLAKNWCVVDDTSLNLTGMVVTATHSGGTYTVPHDMLTVTGFNPTIAGTNTITISYGGKSADSFPVTVVSISSVNVGTTETIKVALNEPLNASVLAKLTVTATYSNSQSEPITITLADIRGFSSTTTGVKDLTVNYRGVTSNTFTVTVVAVTGIAIASNPSKTRYAIGESIDLTGLTITATYSDSSTAPATFTIANISGFNSSAATASQTVTVTYSGHTATFTVKIYATVTFNPNGGNWSGSTANQTRETEGNAEITPPADPTRELYGFTGWYTETSGGTKLESATRLTDNTTLYAQWESQPLLTGTVSINGIADVGETLTTTVSLSGSGTIKYQWKRGATDVGSDSSSYTVQTTDKGSTLTVTVTRDGNYGSVVSGATAAVTGYAIGDTGPGGGKIFYVKAAYSGGWKYLEAAANNASSSARWDTRSLPGSISGTSGTAIGTGKTNTAAIIGSNTGSNAAYFCTIYTGGGLSDWFLPSKDELAELYTRRTTIGNLGTNIYWSSSENGNSYAYIHMFDGSGSSFASKTESFYVRPIRQF